MVYHIRKIYQYLDRFHVKNNNQPTLSQAGVDLFKITVFDDCASQLTQTLTSLIAKERKNEEIDKDLMKRCLMCYVDMGKTNIEIEKIIRVDKSQELEFKGEDNFE